jgi:predicted nucleic acid-binding protein
MNKSLVCADAGILIKLVVAEEDSDRADALWEQWKEDGVKVVSPGLLLFELTSVLRKKVHRGLLSPEEGEMAFDTVHRLPVQVLTPSDLHRRAWELAARFNRPAAYDAHYLALAEMMDCEFWTADRRLFNVVKDELPWVHWLGTYGEDELMPE